MNTKMNYTLSALVFAAFTCGSNGALAGQLSCGDTIVVDTKLYADLVDCPGDGIVIGADGVTLNLNGHTIDGSGSGIGPGEWDPGAGVAVRFHKGVTVKNGSIREFSQGVVLDNAEDARVQGLTLTANMRGIELAITDGSVVEKNSIAGSELDGIRLGSSSGNLIQKNHLVGNVFGVGIADGSGGNVVAKNQIHDGVTGMFVFNNCDANKVVKNEITGNGEVGISVAQNSNRTLLEKNNAEENGWDGIFVGSGLTGTVLVKNTSIGNGQDGIQVESAYSALVKNTANHNANIGINAVVGVLDGGGNNAEGNGVADCVNVACK